MIVLRDACMSIQSYQRQECLAGKSAVGGACEGVGAGGLNCATGSDLGTDQQMTLIE